MFVDIAHDVIEGIALDSISRILVFAKTHHGLNENVLNSAITFFAEIADDLEKYGCLPLANVKYLPKTKSYSITGTAAQNRTFLSRLPLILYLCQLKNSEQFFSSPNFKCFSLIVNINSYIHSPCLTKHDVVHLNDIIKKFLEMTVRLHSTPFDLKVLDSVAFNCKTALEKIPKILKPKGHNLCHYSKLTFENGPLRFFSTLCHERSMAKYKLAILSKKNPPIQIANSARLQMFHFINEFHQSHSRLHSKYESSSLANYNFPNIKLPDHGTILSNHKYKNMLLSPGLGLLTQSPTSNWLTSQFPPSFHKICLVYTSSNLLYIIVQNLKVINFHRKFMAYEIEECSEYQTLVVDDLSIKKSFSIHKVDEYTLLFPDNLPYKEY